jgi:hypothetical protein
VLVIGVLLAGQHVPVGLLAQQWAGPATGHGCTEQVCYCGTDCTCDRCAHHDGNGEQDAPAESSGEQTDPGSGELAFRSCSGPSQGLPGAFVVSKSLLCPGPQPGSVPRVAEQPAAGTLSALASQRRGDDVFRPPKPRIG